MPSSFKSLIIWQYKSTELFLSYIVHITKAGTFLLTSNVYNAMSKSKLEIYIDDIYKKELF